VNDAIVERIAALAPIGEETGPGMSPRTRGVGVEIAGSGSALPEHRLTNAELETMMETSDDWILQRTGIRERRRYDASKPYPTSGTRRRSTEATRWRPPGCARTSSDLIVCATMTPDSPTPSVGCRVADLLGCGTDRGDRPQRRVLGVRLHALEYRPRTRTRALYDRSA
jgi:hypothetical protein